MSNDDELLDEMSPDQLRELKLDMLSHIQALTVPTGASTQNIEDIEKIGKYDCFLKDIEAKLATYEKGVS